MQDLLLQRGISGVGGAQGLEIGLLEQLRLGGTFGQQGATAGAISGGILQRAAGQTAATQALATQQFATTGADIITQFLNRPQQPIGTAPTTPTALQLSGPF